MPVFVKVTVSPADVLPMLVAGKLRLAGASDAKGEIVPVPLRATVWVPPGALSLTVSVPLALPVAVGAKVTLMVHELPTANEAPHVLVIGKGPDVLMVVTVNAEPPVLVSVAVLGALMEPTG